MENTNKKGQWGSRFGFLMAAIGSAVGLGNLWGFPYKMGRAGGFAFLIIYLALVALVGIVIMLSEMTLGRKTGKGVIAAYRQLGKAPGLIGWLAWFSPCLILGFYCMLGGYCIKYMIANLGDSFGASWGLGGTESGEFFSAFYTDDLQVVIFTVIFVALSVLIVCGGVKKGIEKFAAIAMPALFVMLVIIIIRSVTLPGASAGLSFVFKPDFSVFKGWDWVSVLAGAGGQMFFSLSLGMAIMVTYGSYMPKEDNIQQSAIIVPIADTVVAVMAAVAIMPAVFAAGLDPAKGPGLLFVTLQTVFNAMGAAGPVFGFLFYLLVFIAAITSSISLLEAVCSAVMDRAIAKGKPVRRRLTAICVGIFIALEGSFVAIDNLGEGGLPHVLKQSTWLDTFDLFSEGLFMPTASLCTALIFGWWKKGWLDDEIEDGGRLGHREFTMKRFFYFCCRWVVPPIMVLVLLGQLDIFFQLGWFRQF